jgi:hypothetical protein
MTSPENLKEITLARIKSAKILMDNKDWQGSAQMMGLALECALKASACRSLRIFNYPESHPKDKKIPDFFKTHSFDRLLLLSGLSDIFSANSDPFIFNNWSAFTIQFQGEWTSMRYNDPKASPFTGKLVKELYNCLYADFNAIIRVIIRKRRW